MTDKYNYKSISLRNKTMEKLEKLSVSIVKDKVTVFRIKVKNKLMGMRLPTIKQIVIITLKISNQRTIVLMMHHLKGSGSNHRHLNIGPMLTLSKNLLGSLSGRRLAHTLNAAPLANSAW